MKVSDGRVFDAFCQLLNIFSLQDILTVWLFTLGSYLEYYFPQMIAFFNNIFFYGPMKRITVDKQNIPECVLLCAKPPHERTSKDKALIRMVLFDLIQVNYKVDSYFYTNDTSDTSAYDVLNAFQDKIGSCRYAVYNFWVNSNTEIGLINPKQLMHFVYYPTPNVLYIAFNGTNSFDEILADIYIGKTSVINEFESMLGCAYMLFHHGFHKLVTKPATVVETPIANYKFQAGSGNTSSIVRFIHDFIQNNCNADTKIYFLGHSLGASMCSIVYFYVVLYTKFERSKFLLDVCNVFMYTYGCPRYTNTVIESYLPNADPAFDVKKTVETIVHNNDIVTKIPFGSPNHTLDYVDAFPSTTIRIQAKDSFFQVFRGALSHLPSSYAHALKTEYEAENSK